MQEHETNNDTGAVRMRVNAATLRTLARPAMLAIVLRGTVTDLWKMEPETIEKGIRAHSVSPPAETWPMPGMTQKIWIELTLLRMERPRHIVLSLLWHYHEDNDGDAVFEGEDPFTPPWLLNDVGFEVHVRANTEGPVTYERLIVCHGQQVYPTKGNKYALPVLRVFLGSEDEVLQRLDAAEDPEERARWQAYYLLRVLFCTDIPMGQKMQRLVDVLGMRLPDPVTD